MSDEEKQDDTPAVERTEEEEQAAFRQHMAFNVEANRAGLMAASLDMLDTMKKSGVPHAEAILLTAAIEVTAQLWAQTMKQVGKTRQETRKTVEKEFRFYFAKHWNNDLAEEPSVQ